MILDDDHIRRIAEHAYKHALEGNHGRFNGERYGPPMGVSSALDLEAKIKTSLASPRLQHFNRLEGGMMIRDPDSNLTIAFRGERDGTAYRDRRGSKSFLNSFERDTTARFNLGCEQVRIRTGPLRKENLKQRDIIARSSTKKANRKKDRLIDRDRER